MDISIIQQIGQYYQLSMGALIGATVLVLALSVLLLSVLCMIAAKVLKAGRTRFGSAILVVLCYFGLSIVLGLVFQLLPGNILYSQFFEIIALVIYFIIFSCLSSGFFKAGFVKGMGITLITFGLLFALMFLMALINR